VGSRSAARQVASLRTFNLMHTEFASQSRSFIPTQIDTDAGRELFLRQDTQEMRKILD
jgi:hypothetical protein